MVFAGFGRAQGRLEYALVLEDAPVAQKSQSRLALRSAESLAQLQRVRNAQSGVLSELKRRKVAVTGTAQTLVNAIFVNTTREAAAELRNIPGVVRVQYLPPVKRDLNTAVDLVNAQAAWSAVGGPANAGAGIKIGIIDTGIDIGHPGFNDAGFQAPSLPADADPSAPRNPAFQNNKVIVARSYVPLVAVGFNPVAGQPEITSRPDDVSPRDRVGHGTAIAMIAAGVRNTGPQGDIQGLAPKAFLGNYKVFGSPGVNDFSNDAAVIQALEDALADGMDVVTLSLNEGDPAGFGPLDIDLDPNSCGGQCDVRAQAVENAVAQGLVVVASAGNDGNAGTLGATLNTIHTPGTAPHAITVGASTNAHVLSQSVHLTGANAPSNLQNIAARFGDGPHVASPLSGRVVDITQLQNDGQACSALPAGSLNGAIALVEQGTCIFANKIVNAENAGAKGVIIYRTSGSDHIFGVQNTGIPAVMIGNRDGLALKAFADSNPGANVSLDPALTAPVSSAPDTVAPFSSRGPAIGITAVTQTFDIKPELVAPGDNIYTAAQKLDPNGENYNASGYAVVSGTSYAVGMVAGAVALVKQAMQPVAGKLTAPQLAASLKSAVVNTADSILDSGVTARVNAAGAGRLNAGKAVSVAATLDPPTICFGAIASISTAPKRTLNITNLGNAAATFSFAVQPSTSSSASVTLSQATLTLQPGQQNSVTVSLTGTRPGAGSYEGFIAVTSGTGTNLRVPYLYLVGDNVPRDIFPVANGLFAGAGDSADNQKAAFVGFKVIDQFGVPVALPPGGVRFNAVKGGSIALGDTGTDRVGDAFAEINLGTGDQVITATAGGLSIEFDGFARAYPSIAGANNAASGDIGQGLAPGSYISIYGTALADVVQVESTSSLPVSLSWVSVSFDDGGLSVPGHLHFVSPGQINVQIPWEFQGHSSVAMKVTASYLPSAVFTVPLATYSPGILEYSDSGTSSALVQDINFVLVSHSNPAQRAQGITIYMNGLGPVSPQPASGEASPSTQPFATTPVNPMVTIGGVNARVIFSGMTPGFVGLYQVNAILDQNTPTGLQTLDVSMNGVVAKTSHVQVQ